LFCICCAVGALFAGEVAACIGLIALTGSYLQLMVALSLIGGVFVGGVLGTYAQLRTEPEYCYKGRHRSPRTGWPLRQMVGDILKWIPSRRRTHLKSATG
jgi:hypothetical protein